MVAYTYSDYALVTTDDATQARISSVSADFWELSGVQPTVGRLPNPGERDVLLLSHRFFERWFKSDPSVVGRAVTVEGRQVTITGVLPKDFLLQLPQESFGPQGFVAKDIDGYRSLIVPPQERGRGQLLRVVAKLKPNMPLDRARAELEAIRARLARTNPQPYPDQAILIVLPLRDKLVGQARLALWVLLAAVVLCC